MPGASLMGREVLVRVRGGEASSYVYPLALPLALLPGGTLVWRAWSQSSLLLISTHLRSAGPAQWLASRDEVCCSRETPNVPPPPEENQCDSVRTNHTLSADNVSDAVTRSACIIFSNLFNNPITLCWRHLFSLQVGTFNVLTFHLGPRRLREDK